jgi:hypothetical protein
MKNYYFSISNDEGCVAVVKAQTGEELSNKIVKVFDKKFSQKCKVVNYTDNFNIYHNFLDINVFINSKGKNVCIELDSSLETIFVKETLIY